MYLDSIMHSVDMQDPDNLAHLVHNPRRDLVYNARRDLHNHWCMYSRNRSRRT